MHQITELWNKLKSMLHHGPSLQPLWQAVVDKLGEHEASIDAIKVGPKADIDEMFENADAVSRAYFYGLEERFEARIAALEEKLTLMSTPSEPAPAPWVLIGIPSRYWSASSLCGVSAPWGRKSRLSSP